MKFIGYRGIFVLLLGTFVHSSYPSFHPKMGTPHILDPQGQGLMAPSSIYHPDDPFSPSQAYMDLQVAYKRTEQVLQETQAPEKKVRLKKLWRLLN